MAWQTDGFIQKTRVQLYKEIAYLFTVTWLEWISPQYWLYIAFVLNVLFTYFEYFECLGSPQTFRVKLVVYFQTSEIRKSAKYDSKNIDLRENREMHKLCRKCRNNGGYFSVSVRCTSNHAKRYESDHIELYISYLQRIRINRTCMRVGEGIWLFLKHYCICIFIEKPGKT